MAADLDTRGEGSPPPEPLRLGGILLLSFVIPGAGLVVYEILHWSNHVEGLKCALFFALPVLGLLWCFSQLPWSIAVFGLYRWRGWRRFRTAWALAPAVLSAAYAASVHVVDPPTPERMCEWLIVSPIPGSVSALKAFRSGGGLVAHDCLLYFEIDPGDFPLILGSRPFRLTAQQLDDLRLFRTSSLGEPVCPGIKSLVGEDRSWPMPDGWEGVEVYRFTSEGDAEYTIVTDQEHRRVYFHADDFY